MIIQLNPSIPVHVMDKGKGEAIGWLDYGKEDHLIWIVAMNNTGEVWLETNPNIRLLPNYTIGRKDMPLSSVKGVNKEALKINQPTLAQGRLRSK